MASLQSDKLPWRLKEKQELRIEVKEEKSLELTLRDGQAEIFGTELQLGDTLTLKGQKCALFTWRGCIVELAAPEGVLSDVLDVAYDADETPQEQYVSMHYVLQARRSRADTEGTQGPRVVVVGPTDVGKSSLCKLLLNYAVREGAAPTMVDLDIGICQVQLQGQKAALLWPVIDADGTRVHAGKTPVGKPCTEAALHSQGAITAPGSIAATPVEAPVDVEEGLTTDVPLVFYYGHTTPEANPALYRHLVERLAGVLDRRTQQNAKVRADGMVVNTMGWVDGLGYELLLHSIDALKADVVLVVGQDRLHSQLREALRSQRGVEILKVARSEGVVTRSAAFRKSTRTQRCREYFYGPQGTLLPHAQTVRQHELKIYRIGGGPRAPTSALPIGSTSVADPLRLAEVRPGRDLVQSLLAVSHAATPDELLATNVAGFLYVTAVDPTQGTLSYLAPCPGSLPGRFLLAGLLKVYFE